MDLIFKMQIYLENHRDRFLILLLILPKDVAHIKGQRKHPALDDNVVKHKAFNDSINSFINTTTGHMTMLRIAKKDSVFCYTIRSQNTYCKEHTRGLGFCF